MLHTKQSPVEVVAAVAIEKLMFAKGAMQRASVVHGTFKRPDVGPRFMVAVDWAIEQGFIVTKITRSTCRFSNGAPSLYVTKAGRAFYFDHKEAFNAKVKAELWAQLKAVAA